MPWCGVFLGVGLDVLDEVGVFDEVGVAEVDAECLFSGGADGWVPYG